MLMKPHAITVTISNPIEPTGKEWKNVIQLRDEVRKEIAKYCGEPSLDSIVAGTVAPGKI
jgi:hypothetical protein